MQKQRLISTVFIWINVCFFAFAQSSYSAIDLNHKLKQSGNDELTLKEYLRSYYLDKNNSNETITKDIGGLFSILGFESHAIKYYNLYQYSLRFNDPKRAEISFEKAKIHLKSTQYQEAILELLQVNKITLPDKDRLNYYVGICYLFVDKYKEGINKLKQLSYINEADFNQFDETEMALIKNEKKNPKRARTLSVILPGLGQAVNGQVKDGANSFLLIGGLTYFMLDLATVLSLPNSILSFGPWIFRYYVGGINNARKASELKKHNTKNALILNLLEKIEENRKYHLQLH